jgi:hypothetical protein
LRRLNVSPDLAPIARRQREFFERPSPYTPKGKVEKWPLHSITSSATEITPGGTWMAECSRRLQIDDELKFGQCDGHHKIPARPPKKS